MNDCNSEEMEVDCPADCPIPQENMCAVSPCNTQTAKQKRQKMIKRLKEGIRELREMLEDKCGSDYDSCEELDEIPCPRKKRKLATTCTKNQCVQTVCRPNEDSSEGCCPKICPCKPKPRTKCCKPNPKINNPYFNFLREYRKKCCDEKDPECSNKKLAKRWCALPPACKRKYKCGAPNVTCKRIKRKKPILARIFSYFGVFGSDRPCRKKRRKCKAKPVCRRKEACRPAKPMCCESECGSSDC